MTSSATQTEAHGVTPRDPVSDPGGDRSGGDGGPRERLSRWAGARAEPLGAAALVAAGWLLILAINRWHLGAPAVFLCLGWLSIVAAGWLLWQAAMRAGNEAEAAPEEVEEFSQPRLAELEREKKTLLKAIKEVEFDRELGKMSEEDASEIVRVYRARAIEILKLLDGGDLAVEAAARQEMGEPIDQVIDREVRARMALAGIRSKVKDKTKAKTEGTGTPEVNIDATPDEDEAVKP